jgi:hypothetical protein
MKKAEKLFKDLLNENLGYIDLKPISQIETTPKADFENKFAEFLAEESKREKEDEAVKVDSKKVAKSVEEIEDHNFDYKDQKNLDNQIGQEVMNGVYFEAKQNPDKTIDEIKEIVSKNLAKDRQYYMKNAAFGVEGIGYEDTELEEVSGKYAASGYSDKLKKVVKESLMGESYDEFQRDDKGAKGVDKKDKGEEEAFGAGVEKGEKIEKKKMSKKAKKESIDTDLAEIDKQAQIVALEAKLNKIDEVIESKMSRINMVSEDENLSELVDKKKMKAMQKEVKVLEKRKAKMGKMYEKMCGKTYQREEIVDEVETINENEQLNENDMVVSYRGEKIPIKFTGFKAFDGRDGSRDTTDNKGRFVVALDAERTDGKPFIDKEKFTVHIVTNPGVSKITQDGTVPFPDFSSYTFKPKVEDFGKTIDFIKKNIDNG